MACLYHLALFVVVHCAIVSSSHSRVSDMEMEGNLTNGEMEMEGNLTNGEMEMEGNLTNGESRPNVRNGPEFTNRVLFSDIYD